MIFSSLELPRMTLPNRVIRSATYEGMGEADGTPRPELGGLYGALLENYVGAVITGFCFISKEGRAMQPGQCGIDNDGRIPAWKEVVRRAKHGNPEGKLLMQIAHTGRQTLARTTGCRPISPSQYRSPYFRETPRVMTPKDYDRVLEQFAAAAARARDAGFDGVQLHAAHGYLLHQILSPATNSDAVTRRSFLPSVLQEIRSRCGESFPVWIKMSGMEDNPAGMTPERVAAVINNCKGLDAVEVSYGTMDLPLNIIRGGCPVDIALTQNPLFNRYPRTIRKLWKQLVFPHWRRRFLPFAEMYNLEAAARIRRAVPIPVFAVGGFRSAKTMVAALAGGLVDAVSLCRPLICEPNFAARLYADQEAASACTSCNCCTLACDGQQSLQCYAKPRQKGVPSDD